MNLLTLLTWVASWFSIMIMDQCRFMLGTCCTTRLGNGNLFLSEKGSLAFDGFRSSIISILRFSFFLVFHCVSLPHCFPMFPSGLERNGGLQLLPPLRAGMDSHRARKLEAGRHPDIPLLQDAIFLPALEEDWPRQSPRKASPQLWSRAPKRAPEPPRDAPNRSPKLLKPPGLAPGVLVNAKLNCFQIFQVFIGFLWFPVLVFGWTGMHMLNASKQR